MKKIIFFLLLFNTTYCPAQDGFSLSADYGLGRCYERKANPAGGTYYQQGPWSFSPVACSKADLYISYKKGHWIVKTGVGYWKDGYKRSTPDQNYYNVNLTTLTSNGSLGVINPNTPRITETFNYPRIVVPLLLGYQFNLTKKFSIIPYIGAQISNNRNSSIKVKEDTITHTADVTTNDFNRAYKRTDWWALAQLDISYSILPRWNITLGPHFAYMLTDMVKNEYWAYEQSPLKLYNITINAGISWTLSQYHADKNTKVE